MKLGSRLLWREPGCDGPAVADTPREHDGPLGPSEPQRAAQKCHPSDRWVACDPSVLHRTTSPPPPPPSVPAYRRSQPTLPALSEVCQGGMLGPGLPGHVPPEVGRIPGDAKASWLTLGAASGPVPAPSSIRTVLSETADRLVRTSGTSGSPAGPPRTTCAVPLRALVGLRQRVRGPGLVLLGHLGIDRGRLGRGVSKLLLDNLQIVPARPVEVGGVGLCAGGGLGKQEEMGGVNIGPSRSVQNWLCAV